MSTLTIISISLLIVFAALFSVSMANSRETRRKLVQQRLSQLKRKITEMEETAISVGVLTGSVKLEKILVEDIVDTLKGMLQLEPNSASTSLSLENAQQRLLELTNHESINREPHRILESDAQIARAQFQLSEAGRTVRKRQSAGLLEASEMHHYIQELAWANLMVQVITLISQGQKIAQRGDVLRAHAFFKKGFEYASAAQIPDERRHQLVTETAELMNNKRKALSKELMPEYEPQDSSDTL
jgi:hypothetical protein